jgi:hypothetical protein
MRVLCIKDGFSSNKDITVVKRGCIYNVTNVINDKYNKQHQTDIWYELLETGKNRHIGTLFVLCPEEMETSINIKNKEKK